MFTSRGPRNPEEIAACVSFYRNSPLWTDSGLTEEQLVDCWEELLKSGIGGIDIIEHPKLAKDLKRPQKVATHPHFEHAFVYVDFYSYVSLELARELLVREDDSEDALLHFSRKCLEHQLDSSSLNPLPDIAADGRIQCKRLTVFSTGIYHSDIVTSYTLRTFKYLRYSEAFARRAFNSVRQDCIGIDHEAALHATAGQFLVEPYKRNGLRLARKYARNTRESASRKKFIFCVARNDSVARYLGNPALAIKMNDPGHSQYTFMFLHDDVVRSAGLSRLEQQVCRLLLSGYDYKQIANAMHPSDYQYYSDLVSELKSKSSSSSLTEQENATLKDHAKHLAGVVGRVKAMHNEASTKLANAGYYNPPYQQERLIAELTQNPTAAHEIREFLFPIYPWPDELPSRP